MSNGNVKIYILTFLEQKNTMAVVHKARHSLIGKSLVQVVLRLKAPDGNAEDLMLAR